MTTDIRAEVLAALADIAPEVAEDEVDPSADLLDEYDLDSMDLLNLVTQLNERLGVEVPEEDYPHLRTLDGAVAYLSPRAPDPAT